MNRYFGMRKIEVGKPNDKGVPRIVLNGQPVFLRGPLDQGFWPDGLYTAPTDDALKYDIEITKKLGFNMTRKHVKVEPERWYYWCDKLGLLVLQDMPAGDKGIGGGQPDLVRTPESAKEYDTELERMIVALYNHPSIIMWVVFNEGWGQFDTARVVERTKTADPTRLVDDASGWNDRKVGDVIDMHAYPGPGCPEGDGKRALVLGEFGGLGLQIDGHTWEKKIWGYQGVKNSEDLTRKYEKLWQSTYELKNDKGLSAAVYTQLTDVETEGNGLLTYDRGVIKPDLARAAAAADGDFSRCRGRWRSCRPRGRRPRRGATPSTSRPTTGSNRILRTTNGSRGRARSAPTSPAPPSARNGRAPTFGCGARRRCPAKPFPIPFYPCSTTTMRRSISTARWRRR